MAPLPLIMVVNLLKINKNVKRVEKKGEALARGIPAEMCRLRGIRPELCRETGKNGSGCFRHFVF